jgi:hypothetical protein
LGVSGGEAKLMLRLVVGYAERSCRKLKKRNGFLEPNFGVGPKRNQNNTLLQLERACLSSTGKRLFSRRALVLELLDAIPGWLGAAICGGLGWLGHVGYLTWQNYKKPYEQDKNRFTEIIEKIDPYAFSSFQHIDVGDFSASDCEALLHASLEIDVIDKFGKKCIDKDLQAKEKALVTVLDKITNYISWKSFYRGNGTTRRTFLWDNYSGTNSKDVETSQKIQAEIEELGKELFTAFTEYKTYGDRKYAKKI